MPGACASDTATGARDNNDDPTVEQSHCTVSVLAIWRTAGSGPDRQVGRRLAAVRVHNRPILAPLMACGRIGLGRTIPTTSALTRTFRPFQQISSSLALAALWRDRGWASALTLEIDTIEPPFG